MLTEVGPVEIDVPRVRDATFEPKIIAKRQRRSLLTAGAPVIDIDEDPTPVRRDVAALAWIASRDADE